MSEIDFLKSIKNLSCSFEKRMTGGVNDIREQVALIDFYIRVIYLLAISESRSTGESPLRINGTPGFGSMYAIVKQAAKKQFDTSGASWEKKIQHSANNIISGIEKFKIPNRYASFKSMRDRLSHGQPLPADDQIANLILTNLKEIIEKIQETLNNEFSNVLFEEKKSKIQIVLAEINDPLDISLLWASPSNQSAYLVYSHITSDAIFYMAPGGELHADDDRARITKFTKNLLLEKNNSSPEIGRLVKEALRDISAFTEDYSTPSFYFGDDEDAGNIYIPWVRSTSDENQSRTDVFRVGSDNRKEWRENKSQGWVAYSEFLRDVTNWPILARRIGIGLDSFKRNREEEETSRLGISQSGVRGPANLKEVYDNLQIAPSTGVFQLDARIDDSCQKMKPSTAVYFLVGQAGLGKTDLMLSLARERASKIEENPSEKDPLYLFVSSTGRTLASLEDAVNSSLNITKLLSSHGAKALCRNGLLVLLVDGFDELLGSSGYQNALGSLEPWFRELGGRGVLVASARSSYYLTQYRQSLAEIKDINVDHTLIELQPWNKAETKQYLIDSGATSEALNKLEDRDWKILGIPFFSKAFSAWLSNENKEKNTEPLIFDIVVDQYLERESLKLEDPHQGALLSRDELKSFFSEVAEIMQLGKLREIEQIDLQMCAQQIIGADSLESHRPGLSKRLSSLCGLGVDVDATKPAQFGFSHDVMYDCFLSSALQNNVASGVSRIYFKNILEKSKINSSVFDWIFQKNNSAAHLISSEINFSAITPDDSEALSENLGTLWQKILIKSKGVPPTEIAEGLRLSEIELATSGWSKITFRQCKIGRLQIPSEGNFRITIENSEIELLQCEDKNQIKRVVQDLESTKISCIHVSNVYEDTPMKVRSALADFGLIRASTIEPVSPLFDACEYFLERIKSRPDVQIVVVKDEKISDDPRLGWSHKLGNSVWLEFLEKICQHNLARWEAMPTSGKSKVRLVFNATPSEILRKIGDNEDIVSFWGGMNKTTEQH